MVQLRIVVKSKLMVLTPAASLENGIHHSFNEKRAEENLKHRGKEISENTLGRVERREGCELSSHFLANKPFAILSAWHL